MTKAVPEGFSTITPTLVCTDASAAMELYKKAFGATEDYCMKTPEGKVMHACLTIGTSKLFLSDEMPGCGAANTDSRFFLYVEDCDAAFKKATSAGLEQMMAPEDMFWGDRCGAVKDSFGNMWNIATHIKDVSEADMQKGAEAFNAKMKSGGDKDGKKAA